MDARKSGVDFNVADTRNNDIFKEQVCILKKIEQEALIDSSINDQIATQMITILLFWKCSGSVLFGDIDIVVI